MSSPSNSGSGSVMWFRRGLQIHDNLALGYAAKGSKRWGVNKLCFECDTDPYYQALDIKVKKYASTTGIEIGGNPPTTYQAFLKLAGQPSWASSLLTMKLSSLPPVGNVEENELSTVPAMEELGCVNVGQDDMSSFRSGETEALKIMKESLHNKFGCLSSRNFYLCVQDVYKNAKMHTSPPVSLAGQMKDNGICKQGTPQSQVNWGRCGCRAEGHFLRNHANVLGLKIGSLEEIPWDGNDHVLVAWTEARTGYPWIDAIMVQIRMMPSSLCWIHHLARHCVACFLTHGDVWFVHWEKGRDVFERLLIDSDWAINNGNWLWLSCSTFFYQG
ncbi:Cryptochrome/DNA photolyase, FAD-binding domain [Dillenia turbinata]|uniref:Cryptochrome/DNA photolyase, FAD-binding domain n=1 Tax=Dillenia turbinata TaxID=194707 RepID=A0AAN8US42_9MAGN